MFIAQLRRSLKPALFVVAILVAIAVAGCGLIDEPAPGDDVVADASGAPLHATAEKKALFQSMHNQVTMVFIDQPRFGGGRMFVPSPEHDIVHAPKANAGQTPQRGVANAGQKPPHSNFKKGVEGLGLNYWFADDPVEPLLFRRVQLVGLVKHATPVAYESDNVAMGTDTADIPTRSLDAFESRGLEKLKGGEDLYIEKLSTGKVRVFGPIYAGAKCVACHAQTGQMLGAFSYTFDIGQPKANAGVEPQP